MRSKNKKLFQTSDNSAFDTGGNETSSPLFVSSSGTAGRIKIIKALTVEILGTFNVCNPEFRAIHKLPQRILTNPSEGLMNNGMDNEEANLVCRVHDKIICRKDTYTILDLLGTGTFGQVFKCQKDGTKELVAIKIIKNKTAYHNQGLLEIKIARMLNDTFDPNDEHHLVRIIESFEFKNHVCLVFELLSMSLLDILTQNQFRGLPLSVVQRFTRQILSALVTLEEAKIIHCDLKPENILLSPPKGTSTDKPPESPQVSVTSSSEPASKKTKTDADQIGSVDPSDEQASLGTTKATKMETNVNSLMVKNEPPSLQLVSNNDADSTISSVTETGHTDNSGSTVAGTATAAAVAATAATKTDKSATGANIADSSRQYGGGRFGVWSDIKVIDLGSACFEGKTMYSYIQSRFYRSPEVLLGVPYNGAIDIWSLACVCAEMFLGLPLFPGVSQHNQLTRIVEMFGNPPDALIEGKNGGKYFTKIPPAAMLGQSAIAQALILAQTPSTRSTLMTPQDFSQPPKYRLKTAEEYASETKTEIPVLRKYLRYSKLEDVIMKCPLPNKSRMTNEQKKEEMVRRLCFLNFLQGLFRMNPFERWTAKQAINHPFITNSPFLGDFVPPVDGKINERKLAYLVLLQQKDRIRSSNPSMHAGIGRGQAGFGIQHSKIAVADVSGNGHHEFLPLHRRQSEPVVKGNDGNNALMRAQQPSTQHVQTANAAPSSSTSNQANKITDDAFDVNERRPLHRGMSVIEGRDGKLIETAPQHQSMSSLHQQSLPQFGGNFMRQQEQQYMMYQEQMRQQQADMVDTPHVQYSAYSAATPTGDYLNNYYVMNTLPTPADSSYNEKLSASAASNSSGSNFRNYMESLGRTQQYNNTKTYASASDLQDMVSGQAGYKSSTQLTRHSGTASIKIPSAGGIGAIVAGVANASSYSSGQTGVSDASSFSVTGGQFASPGMGIGSRPPSATSYTSPPQYLTQHLSMMSRSQGIPVNGPHRTNHPDRSGIRPEQASSLTQQLLMKAKSFNSSAVRRDQESPQMFQLSPAQPSDMERSNRDGVNGNTWTDGRIKSNIGVMEGSQPSSLGDSYADYGGSLPGSMTEPSVLMTDFAQALMRPEMDERRRLQSLVQPPMGLGLSGPGHARHPDQFLANMLKPPFGISRPGMADIQQQQQLLQQQYYQSQHHNHQQLVQRERRQEKSALPMPKSNDMQQASSSSSGVKSAAGVAVAESPLSKATVTLSPRDSRQPATALLHHQQQLKSSPTHVVGSTSSSHDAPRPLAKEPILFDNENDCADDVAQNFSVSLIIRSDSNSSSKLSSNPATPLITPRISTKTGTSPLPISSRGSNADIAGSSYAQIQRNSPVRCSPTLSSPSHAKGPTNQKSHTTTGTVQPNSLKEVADALADWDPFFGDFETDSHRDSGAKRNIVSNNNPSKQIVNLDESVDDAEVDDSDWRSTGGSNSRPHSAGLDFSSDTAKDE